MRLSTQLGVVVVMFGLATGVWYWASSQESTAKIANSGARVSVVEVVPADTGRVRETLSAVGTTRATNSVNIVAGESGVITQIAFSAGQNVKTGDVLVALESASEQAAVREAESALVNLEQQFSRAKSLRANNLVSQADVDSLESQLAVARARLQAVRSQLEKRTVRAPFAGVVGLRDVNLGAFVESQTLLTTLDDLSEVELDFQVPERYFQLVNRGQQVQAESIAFPKKIFTGQVRNIDTRIDPGTRAFRVRAVLPNPEANLVDGMFMTVQLVLAEREQAILVPEEAIIDEDNQRFVFVVENQRARKIAVETGQRLAGRIEILTGLTAGMPVVTRGHQGLRDQAEVRLANPPSPSLPAEAS